MDRHTLDEYEAAGCPWYLFTIRTRCMGTFMTVYHAMEGKVCNDECSWFKGGTCPGYLQLTASERRER